MKEGTLARASKKVGDCHIPAGGGGGMAAPYGNTGVGTNWSTRFEMRWNTEPEPIVYLQNSYLLVY